MDELPWDHTGYYGSKDQLHAIGALITAWNSVEMGMHSILKEFFRIHESRLTPLFDDMSNSTRLKFLKTFAEEKETPNVCQAVNIFCKYANICVGNRNLITHATILNIDDKIYARKIASGHQQYKEYSFSLEQIRNAVDETRDVGRFGYELSLFIKIRGRAQSLNGDTKRYSGHVENFQGKSVPAYKTLPEAPAQPVSLTQPPRKKSEHKNK